MCVPAAFQLDGEHACGSTNTEVQTLSADTHMPALAPCLVNGADTLDVVLKV